MVNLICEEQKIRPRLDDSEKNAMLLVGGSRCGKSVLLAEIAEALIKRGDLACIIDLGEKWSYSAKVRLCSVGAVIQQVESEGIRLIFSSTNELIGCAKIIVNAIGFQSVNAKTVLKKVFQKLVHDKEKAGFTVADMINALEKDIEEDSGNEWAVKIYDRLDILSESLPKIQFVVDAQTDFADSSVIWDLSGIDDEYVQVISDLIGYTLLCQQKRYFKAGKETKNVFLFIDEFQNLSCNRTSVIGKCLTEGQKYHLYLVLATQFLDSNFSEAVINQFKQGGFRFYFRLTEEEAKSVSRQIAFDTKAREEIYKKLISLPVGTCLMKGPHSIGKSSKIVDNYRFVKVQIDEDSEKKEERSLGNNATRVKIYVGIDSDRRSADMAEKSMSVQKRRDKYERGACMGEAQHNGRGSRRVFRNRNQSNPRINE